VSKGVVVDVVFESSVCLCPGWHLSLYVLRGHPATHESIDVSGL
jgi:hypothetical protein